jgi:hypothetical protein
MDGCIGRSSASKKSPDDLFSPRDDDIGGKIDDDHLIFDDLYL